MGWYVVYYVIMQSWVVGGYFRIQIMRICLSKFCLKNWCGWDVIWGRWCSVCVRESVSKPAILAQASQARRGWLLFWAGVRLAQVRPSRLSEIAKQGMCFFVGLVA